MSGTVDTKRVLLAVMAAATLAVVLAVPMRAHAATDCSAAGSDPTASQYCPPNETPKECEEGNQNGSSGNSPISGSNSGNGANSEECSHSEESASSGTESASAGGGTLPFTGVDVLALLAVAGAFIAVGVALQRLSKASMDRV